MHVILYASDPIVNQLNRELFEIGIHPNFEPLLYGTQGNAELILDSLMKLFPDSKGVRCHNLTTSTSLLNLFAHKGLIYDANLFMQNQKMQVPFKIWNGLLRIPYIWEDDIHFGMNKSFDTHDFNFDSDDLIILNFHPTHVFLNTETTQRYIDNKKYYHLPEQLIQHRNNTRIRGVCNFLHMVLDEIVRKKVETFTLSEIAKAYL